MNKALCCIFNFASHYRESIFTKMDQELNCVFYFGNIDPTGSIKKMDYTLLRNFKGELKVSYFYNFSWINGSTSLLFKHYDAYFLNGEPFCLSTWVFLIMAKFKNKKVFLWSHGWYGREGRFKTFLKKIFFNLSDKIFLYGNYAKKLMIDNGFDESKLEVIYNSLDYDKQLSVRLKLKKSNIFKTHFNNEYPVLIYLGRIQKSKRLDLLIDSISQLKKKQINVNLVVVGKIIESSLNIVSEVKNKNLDKNIWFYGPCYDENRVGELIYNSLICVSPGNIGLTAIHSMAYGTPVVTHNNFKNQMPEFEIIENYKTGVFFNENDLDSLIQKIQYFIDLSDSKLDFYRINCFRKIDNIYNPSNQILIFKKNFHK